MAKKPNITGVGFEFVEDGHSYYLEGKRMTGVTTILSCIAKPQLIQWAANMACDYIDENLLKTKVNVIDLGNEVQCLWVESVLKEARVAHRKKKESAGKAGTDVHAIIERIIKEAISENDGIVSGASDNEQVAHFMNWAKDNKVKFLASEQKVYSKELFVGGTIDFVCEIDGDTWIGDIKTSSAIYPEHFFQTAGYQKLLGDMGSELEIKGHIILNCRKDGTFEEKRSISNEDNLLAFMSAYNLYRVIEKLKGTII